MVETCVSTRRKTRLAHRWKVLERKRRNRRKKEKEEKVEKKREKKTKL